MSRRKRKPRGLLVAAEARTWVGTPFIWGQSVKQVGCDCKGLVWGVARELGFPEAGSFYASFNTYRRFRPIPSDLLVEGMADLFDRADEPGEGDVLLLLVRGKPQHMAICGGNDRVIHAYGEGERKVVRESRLSGLLVEFPLHSVWRWRDVR